MHFKSKAFPKYSPLRIAAIDIHTPPSDNQQSPIHIVSSISQTYANKGVFMKQQSRDFSILSICAIAFCLAVGLLAGCSNNQTGNDQPTSAQEATSTLSEDDFVGTWETVSFTYDGMTMTGDLEAAGYHDKITFGEDGSFTIVFPSTTVEGTWSMEDGQAVVVTEGDDGMMAYTPSEGGTLLFAPPDMTMQEVFAREGTVSKPAYDPTEATPIDDGSFLTGTWVFTAQFKEGVCYEYDPAEFEQGDGEYSYTFNEDGTVSLVYNGETSANTWRFDNGTTVVVKPSGDFATLNALGNDLMIGSPELAYIFTRR